MSALEQVQVSPSAVLAKAVLNAAEQIGVKQKQLASVLGLHPSAISRLKQNPSLDPESKQGELALLFVRLARALLALSGQEKQWAKYFMTHHNKVTGGIPVEQITSIEGLIKVLGFVDALRGKV